MRQFTCISTIILLAILVGGRSTQAGDETNRIPLRIDFVGDPRVAVPVTGGIPFPRGALSSPDHVRVLSGAEEIPAQVAATAHWPDGTVKWVLVDLVLAPGDAGRLELEYGPEVRRAKVPDPLRVKSEGGKVEITGPGLSARVAGGRSLAKLVISGRQVVSKGAGLVLEAIRTEGPGAFPGPSRICTDLKAPAERGVVEISDIVVEASGPVRARVLVRGHFLVPRWGTGLPAWVQSREPAERVPFSLRYTFHRGLPVVTGSHQFVFTGEPDRDFITRLGLELPGQGAGTVRLIEEPGLTTDTTAKGVSHGEERLCVAPLKDGFALIRDGWENRPNLVGGAKGKAARLDFWPREAGIFDLRRYAREWGVGESGNRDRPLDMELYARYAARGLAKSHRFVLHFGGAAVAGDRRVQQAFAEPALILAPPGWYSASRAMGHFAAGSSHPAHRELEDGVRRYLDYFIVNQDLYRWHGKIDYGFWQTRNGDIHRIGRWDRDYGRWGWSLGDGAGRIGHVLMLEYLRTGRRRYYRAGEAFNRAVYDTSMVHTAHHLENARPNWWTVKGCNHRHNVQPFGGPYIGMRGSNPGGHRILWFLTGDGVIKDGLDLVASASLEYATGRRGAIGASGGTDGQGTGAMALLFAFETTGDEKYLSAVRTILDKGGLFPPENPERLGYGSDFGLFLAGAEYLDLTGDEGFKKRFLATADAGLTAKSPKKYLAVLATALRLTGEEKYRKGLERGLAELDFTGSLAELPRSRWPGHGGPHRPPTRGNIARDLPYALAPLTGAPKIDRWPALEKSRPDWPPRMPKDSYRPGEAPKRRGRQSKSVAKTVFKSTGEQRSRYLAEAGLAAAEPFAWIADDDGAGNFIRTRIQTESDARLRLGWSIGGSGGGCWVLTMAIDPPPGREHLVAFGVEIPFPHGGDPRKVQLQAAGAHRVERWRVDQSDEMIPGWLNSDQRTRWPVWRGGGILLGPGGSYRIFKQNMPTCAPLHVDQGFGSSLRRVKSQQRRVG